MLLESDGPVEHPPLANESGMTNEICIEKFIYCISTDPQANAVPKWIPKIGAEVAKIFSISESHLQDILQKNFNRFLNS